MATSAITNTIKDASGTAVANVTVTARLRPGPGFRVSDSSEVAGQVTTTSDGSGNWTLYLERTANVTPTNSYWEIEEDIPEAQGGRKTYAISVPNTSGTLYANLLNGLLPATTNPTALTQAAGDARYALTPIRRVNLVPNASMGICTGLPLRRVGSPIAATAYSNFSSGAGMVTISSASSVADRCGGLVAGKLCLAESGAPSVTKTAVSGTVTSNKRITCAGGTFTGFTVGDTVFLTGGTMTSPTGQYRVTATDASTYIELWGGTAGTILVNETKTYTLTKYTGGYAIDATLNAMPATGDPVITTAIGYPLRVAKCNAGSFVATLDGAVLNSSGTSALTIWEVTPADDGYGTGDACDGWRKSPTLRYYRTFKVDTDGTTAVAGAGSAYGAHIVKGVATVEQLTTDLSASNAVDRAGGNPYRLAELQGRMFTFGMLMKAGAGATLKLLVNDGVTTTASAAATTMLEWVEVTAVVDSAATELLVGVTLEGAAGVDAFVSQPMATPGPIIGGGNWTPTTGHHVFASHPNMPRYVNGTVPSNQLVRLEQETLGTLPDGLLKSLHVGLEFQNNQPAAGSMFVEIADSPTQYIPSITSYAQARPAQLAFSTGLTGIGAGVTTYIGQGYAYAATIQVADFRIGFDGQIGYLFAQTGGSTTGTRTYTVMVNDVATTITCSSSGTSTQTSDLTHFVTVARGDRITIRLVTDGSASTDTHQATLLAYPTTGVIVNSGVAVIGRFAEAYPSGFASDCLYVMPGNSGVYNVNIDMFACEL